MQQNEWQDQLLELEYLHAPLFRLDLIRASSHLGPNRNTASASVFHNTQVRELSSEHRSIYELGSCCDFLDSIFLMRYDNLWSSDRVAEGLAKANMVYERLPTIADSLWPTYDNCLALFVFSSGYDWHREGTWFCDYITFQPGPSDTNIFAKMTR